VNSGALGSTVRAAFPLYIEWPTKNLVGNAPAAGGVCEAKEELFGEEELVVNLCWHLTTKSEVLVLMLGFNFKAVRLVGLRFRWSFGFWC